MKLIGKYEKLSDIKLPYLQVLKLRILEEELKEDFYLIDTGCEYDIVISELFISEETKEKLESSGKGKWEFNVDGKPDRMLTMGTMTLGKDYSKEVFICIWYHSRLIKGEKIIGMNIINDFITILDPFKDYINLVR